MIACCREELSGRLGADVRPAVAAEPREPR